MSFRNQSVVGSAKSEVDDRLRRFQTWRSERPFWGGVLLCLAGIVIGWVPAQFLGELMFIGGTFTVIGMVFAALVFLSGVFVLYRPELSTVLGVTGIALSILSLFGALGGLLVGMIVGIVGGNLCIAWKPPEEGVDDQDAASASGSATAD